MNSDDIESQTIVDMIMSTCRYRSSWTGIDKNFPTPGNRAYYKRGSDGREYIFRTDVWSDSKGRFVETRWYPETGHIPYMIKEYNED
jgi:hypothetical protein